jgi:hypothetical protein
MKFTKDELLAKGIDPTVADEIVSSYDHSEEVGTPLSQLEKALKPKKGNDEQSLFKAEKGEKEGDAEDDAEPDEDADDETKAKYMKKKALKKADGDEEDEEKDEKEMKKAFDSIDRSAPGAVVEMETLDPALSAIQTVMSSMLKAVNALSTRVDKIVAQNDESYDLMHKAAELQVETSKGLSAVLATPVGRKGVNTVDMKKAQELNADLTNRKLVYQVLAKAVSMKDPIGGAIAERYESAGHDIRALSKEDRAGIAKLIQENNK